MAVDVHGILLLDKPLGLSSAGAVARLKYLFDARKAGHTGSLDPLASGMLPICFGEATKFGALMLDADKTYRVTCGSASVRRARIGSRRSSNGASCRHCRRSASNGRSRSFRATTCRCRPCIRRSSRTGRPLYEYARAGEVRERAARRIVIHAMRADRVALAGPCLRCALHERRLHPRAWPRISRRSLGTIGHLTGLRRLAVAPFADAPQWTFGCPGRA